MGKIAPCLVILMLFFLQLSCSSFNGTRLELKYIYSNGNLTKSELIHRALTGDKHRIASLRSASSASTTGANLPIHWGSSAYITDFAIGTPAQSISVLVDTGSDLIWTQCKSCTTCFSQSTPPYDPSQSSTYKNLPCDNTLCTALPKYSCSPDCTYLYSYVGGTSTEGYLSTETFTLGSDAVPGMAFGCGIVNSDAPDNSSGILGLSRGDLSLVSQLGVGRFSYCLASYGDRSTSPLLLGSLANLSSSAIQSTPLVENPIAPFSSFYYLSLGGITIGNTLLPISSTAFELAADGSGGLIIDSGTTITYLIDEAYQLVKQEFITQMSDLQPVQVSGGLDLCFSVPAGTTSLSVPRMVFNFEGAEMRLPGNNYFFLDSDNGLLCLMMNSMEGISIFGNYQQQNMHILYDVDNGLLSFEPAECNQL
ncbi:aspartic proteinase nepenthesin-1-like [Typha latifolia]|uniref:aspartic proteinase nepenthesin-1-like n=1 Tax=Typha latifolia TaxID=4733 RepID=UPI003C2EBD28